MEKDFNIPGSDIKRVIPYMGSCLATDHITVEARKVGYMYREEPDDKIDSGWRFFSGAESDDYVNDPVNLARYDVNTICNYDPAIIPYLESEAGRAFGRVEGTNRFEEEPLDLENR
ncbi:DUF2185 domain-containing protein [Luteolibacter marinus]|uniref:DUF2185 domain-containing protein n=1 Tax=Luteolibacter marinus TaxID=2776705 RepID=UPI001865AFA3|nr:DUF2185 domain-containing protein [Luteolibacter marinus]